MYSSYYELTLDPKNRLSLPSDIRNRLDTERDGNGFYIVPGKSRRSLALYPEKAFEQYAEHLHGSLEDGQEKDLFEMIFYGMATLLEIDKQGRVVVPQRIMEQAGLGRKVVLSGARDHLVLWDHQAFQDFVEEHLPRHRDLLRQARDQSKGRHNGDGQGQ